MQNYIYYYNKEIKTFHVYDIEPEHVEEGFIRKGVNNHPNPKMGVIPFIDRNSGTHKIVLKF